MEKNTDQLEVRFLGATGTVTGSKFLLAYRGNQILLDCGLFQGLKELRLRNWAPLPLDISSLRAVVLTHAHIDHSAYLPKLVKLGFRGDVYATSATCDPIVWEKDWFAVVPARKSTRLAKKGVGAMGEFLQNNWFWIVLIIFFIWMHGSGAGCGGHGGHGGGNDKKKREEGDGHQH